MLALAVLAVLAAPSPAASPTPASPVLAVVDGAPITAADLEAAGGTRFFAARSQFYNVQRQALDDAIARRLVEKEAAARGTTPEALLRQEVDEKVTPVTEAEKKAFYEQNKARVPPNMSEAEALGQVESYLRQERLQQRRAEFIGTLRSKAGVKVLLDAPRITVDTGDDPSKGPAAAPITIVEFSDFQCPYCARVLPTLKQIEQRYGDRVRVVFRDMPLAIHRDAPKAAEAASCANEQGRFWQMHDILFANQQRLSVADLKQHAQTAGLDATKFDECLSSNRYADEWRKDMADAERYGVQSTPVFFVNGRMIVGAVPLENFTRIIDEELQRAGLPVPPAAPAATPPPAAPGR